MNQIITRRERPANDHVSLDDASADWPLHALVDLPETGADFWTFCGPAKTIASVWLAPGGGLSRYNRKLAEAHPLVSCVVRADSETWRAAPSPGDFHGVTLRWSLCNADRIAIWSAPFPQFADDVPRWGIAAADEGAHFVTVIETTEARASEWAAIAERWKRKNTPVRIFGPTIAGGMVQ